VVADPNAYRIDVEEAGQLTASIGRFRALADPLLERRGTGDGGQPTDRPGRSALSTRRGR
jgi:hypothetical protein